MPASYGAAMVRGVDGEDLEPAWRVRVLDTRVARLATVGGGGRPHVVPFCFAFSGRAIVSAVDDKPKRTLDLARLRNIRADPRVEVVFDHYEDDWRRVWWVRVRGAARLLEEGPEREAALDRLVERYEQYRLNRPRGAVLSIDPEQWTAWSGDEGL